MHCALPEMNLDDVSTATEVLGWQLQSPLFISCMTGGTDHAHRINWSSPRQPLSWASRSASARRACSSRSRMRCRASRSATSRRRLPLFANLGAVQLNLGVTAADCARLVEMLGADALVLHLNALQEALQPRATPASPGSLERIEEVAGALPCPSSSRRWAGGSPPNLSRALLEAGVAAVDVAGAGGTSWSEVERHRLGGPAARTAAAFAGWGIPTAVALTQARAAAPDAVIFASGGVRSGLDVAIATALGADLIGVAGPFLRAAVGDTRPASTSGANGRTCSASPCSARAPATSRRCGPVDASSARTVAPIPGADGVTLVTSLIETISDLRGTQVHAPPHAGDSAARSRAAARRAGAR